jgi:hypothetical protein
VLLDNMKHAVVRILPDRTRERTAAFPRLIRHYVFKDQPYHQGPVHTSPDRHERRAMETAAKGLRPSHAPAKPPARFPFTAASIRRLVFFVIACSSLRQFRRPRTLP